jgi:hypothetical protein
VFLARHAGWDVGGKAAVMTAKLKEVTKRQQAGESSEQQAACQLATMAPKEGAVDEPPGAKQLTTTVIGRR